MTPSPRQRLVWTILDGWRSLPAWARGMGNVTIEVSNRENPRRLGTCWPHQQKLVVYRQTAISDMLTTGLHEMSHAVEIADGHGVAWQSRFAAAVAAVVGHPIPIASGDQDTLTCAARDAMRTWWKHSPHAIGARLLGVT